MPMPRIYLVVQNNVRTGPFTLEELLQQPLQANAMVWVIGQSEDWLSPLEIPDIQGYFIQQSDGYISAKADVLEDIRAKRFTAPVADIEAEHQRAGVLDAHLLEQPSTSTTSIQPTWQEEPAPPPHVVSVAGSTQKGSAPTAGRTAGNKRTLEKEEDSITIARKNWAVVGIALVLMVFVTWNAMFNDGPRIKRNREYAEAASALDTKSTSIENSTPSRATVPTEDLSAVEDPLLEDVAPIVVPNYASHQVHTETTDAFLDSVQRVLDSQEQLMAEVDDAYRKSFLYRKRYNYNQPLARQTTGGSNKSAYRRATSVKPTREGAKVPLSQQVDLQSRLILDKNKQQVNSVELVVKNNSKEVLKTVSVDVYYYKKGEKLLNKETVYFSNLYPKQSITKSIVGNQRATSARFQLGTITTGNN